MIQNSPIDNESPRARGGRLRKESLMPDPQSKVPAARIQFLPEDRLWIAERIQEVLASGQLTLGRYGAEFEREFAAFCGLEHAVAVNSGTSSLEIILRSLGIEGKDVLVPTNTFFATAAAVVHAGANPILLDMDPESFAIRPEDVEKRMTAKTGALIVVHIGGLVSRRMPELVDLAARKGIPLIEDAAHAHGSGLDGKSAGAFGMAGSFSFYPTKVMTCAEGGMIVTNQRQLADEARIYRDQGKASFTRNAHVRMGYNWRMSEPHAIIGLRHLQRLPAMIAERQRIAAMYNEALAGMSNLKTLPVPPHGFCNYYKYIAVMAEHRDRRELRLRLRDQFGVSLAGEVYEEPLHRQPVFAPFVTGPLPVSEDLCGRHICLPIFSGMSEGDVRQVIHALEKTVG
jgi:perosamine synthetase